MATIIPRWEWRTFGSRFGEADARFAALAPTGVQDSDEIYLLAGASDNVKIRDALMDIKLLREVEEHGLERWEPVMKQGFPPRRRRDRKRDVRAPSARPPTRARALHPR